MHLTWKKKTVSFASYLSVILAEMHFLSTYVMVVKTPDKQIIRSKVHCLAFGGDIRPGCRICYTRGVHPHNRSHAMNFPNWNVPLRTRQEYLDADPDLGLSGRSILTHLDVFAGPKSLVFYELHTIGRGVSSELY
ncbi:hypothetical protein [Parasitella parasitica]|uniref:Uncharacterized protein n=1 Tax=Parasitella parasitica TaxID=35722 RepID=A0A0B7N8A6_9FUNG|nr:hypothetical protein [Parasitella parasitica]